MGVCDKDVGVWDKGVGEGIKGHSIYYRKPYSTNLLHILVKINMLYGSPLPLHGSSLLDVGIIPTIVRIFPSRTALKKYL